MNKKLLVIIFLLINLSTFNMILAQEKANKNDYKEKAKSEKFLNERIGKKALKEARAEAKKLTKEGFKTPAGKLPLEKQLENAWQKQVEITTDGEPLWYIASSRAIAGNQSAAILQATNAAKIELAGQIQTKVSQLIESKVANDDLGKEEAASISNVVATSKSVISANLGRIVPLVEVYKTLSNKNVEVIITLGYSLEIANKVALNVIREELSKQSADLANELDKLEF